MVIGGGVRRRSLEGQPVDWIAGRLCSQAGLWQPFHGLAEARWVLADTGILFGLVWGLIFKLKEVGTQVRYTVNQNEGNMKENGLTI